MDDNNHFPPSVRSTTPNQQRPQQQVVPTVGSSNLGSVRSTTHQEQRSISETSSYSHQPRSPLSTNAIRNIERQDQLPVATRLNVDNFSNRNTKNVSYCAYDTRLLTYYDYPERTPQKSKSLAEAGFYYKGINDSVTCYQCNTSIINWERTDDPWEQHVLYNPQCDFVNTAKSTKFITDIKIKYNISLSLHEPQVPPTYPQYKTKEARMRTFNDTSSFRYQTPEDFSDAGLFHSRVADNTICFQCGGGLNKWEEKDIPLVEHLRWYSSCSYLREKLDKETIIEFKLIFNAEKKLISQKPSHEDPASSVTSFHSSDTFAKVDDFSLSNVTTLDIEKAFIYFLEKNNSNPKDYELIPIILEVRDEPKGEFAQLVMESYQRHLKKTSEAKELIQEKENIYQKKLQKIRKKIKSTFLLSQSKKTVQKDSELCKICMENILGITFLPCGHLVTCKGCSETIQECPVCRAFIEKKLKIFFAPAEQPPTSSPLL